MKNVIYIFSIVLFFSFAGCIEEKLDNNKNVEINNCNVIAKYCSVIKKNSYSSYLAEAIIHFKNIGKDGYFFYEFFMNINDPTTKEVVVTEEFLAAGDEIVFKVDWKSYYLGTPGIIIYSKNNIDDDYTISFSNNSIWELGIKKPDAEIEDNIESILTNYIKDINDGNFSEMMHYFAENVHIKIYSDTYETTRSNEVIELLSAFYPESGEFNSVRWLSKTIQVLHDGRILIEYSERCIPGSSSSHSMVMVLENEKYKIQSIGLEYPYRVDVPTIPTENTQSTPADVSFISGSAVNYRDNYSNYGVTIHWSDCYINLTFENAGDLKGDIKLHFYGDGEFGENAYLKDPWKFNKTITVPSGRNNFEFEMHYSADDWKDLIFESFKIIIEGINGEETIFLNVVDR